MSAASSRQALKSSAPADTLGIGGRGIKERQAPSTGPKARANAPMGISAFLAVVLIAWALIVRGSISVSETGVVASADSGPTPSLGVSVNAAVVEDRAGVPPDLWHLGWYALDYEPPQGGQLGTTARLLLPGPEIPLAAALGLVASVENGEVFARERRSTIRVRDVNTGDLVTIFETALFVEGGAFAEDQFFWYGTDVGFEAAPNDAVVYPGGGLWAVPVAPNAEPEMVLAPEPEIATSIAPFGSGRRAPFAASISGATLASPVYLVGGEVGRTDIVDVATLTLRTTVPGFVIAVNDHSAITLVNDGPDAALRMFDLVTGEVAWEGGPTAAEVTVLAAVAADDTVVVQYLRDLRLVISRLELGSGSETVLLTQDLSDRHARPLFMASALSSGEHVVLLEDIGVGPSLFTGEGRAPVALLEVDTGEVTPNAFWIGDQ